MLEALALDLEFPVEVLALAFFSVASFFRSFLLDLTRISLLESMSESDDKEKLESLTIDLEFLVGVLAWSVFFVGSFFRYFLLWKCKFIK